MLFLSVECKIKSGKAVLEEYSAKMLSCDKGCMWTEESQVNTCVNEEPQPRNRREIGPWLGHGWAMVGLW